MIRKILHLDLDAFFCSVEELLDPSLHGKAFAVGGQPDERGVVASCSYAARKFGVRSAMPMSRALRLCPDLLIVASHHGIYSDYSRRVMGHLHVLTPLVEQVSIDEAFLDVSDLPEPSGLIAARLQAAIREETGLPCSIGAATNKLVSKIANDVGKAMRGKEIDWKEAPSAITIVPPGDEAAFLAPLPVSSLWGIGPKTAERLEGMQIRKIGDLAGHSASELERLFGKSGLEMASRARGIDDHPLATSHETKSISSETTFARDVSDPEVLRRTLLELSESVGQRLRHSDLASATVKIKLRWPDFTTLTRQVTLPQAVDLDMDIFLAAWDLFTSNWDGRTPIRLIGVGVAGLQSPMRQLSMFGRQDEKQRRLQAAIDELRDRFGDSAIRRGKSLAG